MSRLSSVVFEAAQARRQGEAPARPVFAQSLLAL
jgi:hypothetical protein